MKFLICANYLPHVLNFRGKLLQDIAALGYEIHVVAPDLKAYATDYNILSELGYSLHEVPMQRTGTNPIADTKMLMAMYSLLHEIQPDFMLSYTIKPVIYGTLAAWLAKVPNRFVLISGLGYTFQQVEETSKRTVFQKLVHSMYQQALKKSSKVFFQNTDDRDLFKSLKLVQPTTPTVVVNGSGVDLSEYNVLPLPRDNNGAIKSSFLLIARLLKDKGIIEYVAAAERVKQLYPEAEFHLVGGLDENPAAISELQLDEWIAQGDITYWGQIKDVRPAIEACSVYVLPSYREGTSRSVLEAMSMGRAIITTDAPGCRETVIAGENGYLVSVKAVDELVEAMTQFIEQPALYEQMGQMSRRIALEKYDVKKVNDHMLSEMGML
ncbi:glycosyltransferase family 4 protein [uncultured Psychrobacter sp.]|jgi:glycosyltransferase involved in cell wall biosynthesis|uniref:glycosyltransferase family 4 protein n=1 Tax=uncultured Psychrobacter sp. TaxID=259303 RepID=UPI00260B4F78|nr:glycosyltransferase family 4 protein [uncultured Psychrobacter sp.]